MSETIRLRHLVASPRHLMARIVVLSLLVLYVANYAFSQGYTIDKTKFEASTRDYPDCKLNVPSSFSQKVINLPWGQVEINIVQVDERVYCVRVQDTKTLNAQSLIIVDYDFQSIYVHDVMQFGQLVPRVYFRAGVFNHIVVAIVDGKLVLAR
jgi:hypothetical protein